MKPTGTPRRKEITGALLLFFISTLLLQAQNPNSVCAVSAGSDHINCQQPIQLNGQPLTPGTDYIYSWSPANLLVNPTSLAAYGTFGGPGVHNQQFVLTMTDTVTGCIATDTVIVSSFMPILGTRYLCPGDTMILDFGPGATMYNWQYYTDTNNVQTFLNQPTQTLSVTAPGTYLGFATFPNCGALTSFVTIVDSCLSSSCSVDAGPDTTFCQQHGQLQATPASPGNYSYSWSPTYGLSNPNIANPVVDLGVHNQQYVVTLTDLNNGCQSTDTVIINAYYWNLDTLYMCNNIPITYNIGPGASQYSVQYTDTSGNFQYSILPNELYVITQPAQYVFVGVYPGCGALTSVITVIDSCSTQSCSVNAGPDTTFCQQHGQLQATPGSPGNYSYSWSPAYGLSNPNIANPVVDLGVNNQQYVVTMTDPSNGCQATDTVIINAYYWNIDTFYMCNNAPITYNIGPGGTNYTYQFVDTSGNGQFGQAPNGIYVMTQPAQYIFIGFYPGCGALTSVITVIDSCNVPVNNVWPGDCNYDLTANMADVLNIGIGYNTSGPVRPNATNQWYAQPMNDWTQNFVNCNYKHADANGDGLINVNDTLPVALNYGLTHPYSFVPELPVTASTPTLELVANYDTCGLQTLVTVDIRMGNSTTPVDSLYGIAFRLSFEPNLIDTMLTGLTFNGSWLGTISNNIIGFQKPFRSSGLIDVCEVGNNQLNRYNGQGSIGSFQIVTTDNLSGISVLHLDLSQVTAVTLDGIAIPVTLVADSVIIDPSVPAGIHSKPAAAAWQVYPNPANDVLTIKGHNSGETIELVNMLGAVVLRQTANTTASRLDVSNLDSGVYFVRVTGDNSTHTKKITITR